MNKMSEEMQRSQYYLHTNGTLIYKPLGGVDASSDFVVKVWRLSDVAPTPETFVDFLREAFVLGAYANEISRLADHNQLDDFYPDWKKQVFKK